MQKTNFKDQIMVSNLTSGVYKFQLTVTDTIGQSDSIKVTVLVLTPEQSEREYVSRRRQEAVRNLRANPDLTRVLGFQPRVSFS